MHNFVRAITSYPDHTEKKTDEDDAYIRNIIKGNSSRSLKFGLLLVHMWTFHPYLRLLFLPTLAQPSYIILHPTNLPFLFLSYAWTPPVGNYFQPHNPRPFSSPPDPTLFSVSLGVGVLYR
jgi:hypothetical protein